MNTDLTRTLAEIANPLPAPIAPPSLARQKAREIIDQNPGTTLIEIVALAYLEGRISGMAEVRAIASEAFDHSTTCQRCGRKIRLGSSTPAPIPLDYVCFNCSSSDEPRAA